MPNKHDIADDQAADWAVLLADAPDDSELEARFHDWLQADPTHAQAWARAQHTWQALGQLDAQTRHAWPDTNGARRAPDNVSPLIQQQPTPASRHYPLKTLAGLAMAACLMLMLLPGLSLHLSADYLTGTGEPRAVTLDDGSQLYLAPESAVRLAYSGQQRRVELLQGKAFFDVTPDTKRPFRVISGSTETTVLGTAFSVDREENGTLVTVEHGRVKVQDSSIGTQQTLTAGQRLVLSWGESATFSELPAADVGGWRRGELIARDLTIGQVIDALRPYQSGTIIVTKAFARQRVTGLYRLDKPTDTLKKLAKAHGGKVHDLGPWLQVVTD
ncbi:MAG: FecR family protein [Alcanivorax sp.]|uniref:FecR family protein n=1 Tax=Alcanivorax sp. TaxID=1872427 RepID=UPI003DA6EA28